MKKYDFTNKTAVITGASSGIGYNLTKLLIEKYNVKVIGIARNEERLKNLQNENEKTKSNFTYKPFDVSILENWQNFYNYLNESDIQPDILINCAGILPKFKKFEDTSIDDLLSVININFLAQVYSTKILLPLIKRSKNPLIINVSSSASLCTFGGISMYSASKSALKSFTESLICEEKIKVVSVMPGVTKTNIFSMQSKDEKALNIVDKIAKSPEKVANKIIKKVRRNKKRIIIGFDAKLMNFFYKLFPNLTPKIITKFLKNSKYKIFEDM